MNQAINQEIIKEITDTIHDNHSSAFSAGINDALADCVNDIFFECSPDEIEERKINALEVIRKLTVIINQL